VEHVRSPIYNTIRFNTGVSGLLDHDVPRLRNSGFLTYHSSTLRSGVGPIGEVTNLAEAARSNTDMQQH
jgi:hypothetical protein